MSLRRGCVRLAISVAAVWFVFWTCAYVLKPYSSLIPEPASFALRISAWSVFAPCLVVTLLLAAWVAVGFWSKERNAG